MAEEITHVPDRRRTQLLAAGMFLAPLAWGSQLLINYSLTPTACATGREWLLHLVSLAAVLTALGGTLIAWRTKTRLTSGSTEEGDPRDVSRRFLALAGLGLSAFFVLVILALELPAWWLDPCQR